MGLYNLDKIFKPTSVTVVGASETQGTIGRAVIATPVSTVSEIVRECVAVGVGGAIIFSAFLSAFEKKLK